MLPQKLQNILRAVLWGVISTAGYCQPLYYTEASAAKLTAEARQRIEAIAALLENHPQGFGMPVEKRDFWEQLGNTEAGQNILRKAESLIQRPMPLLTDELYLMYSQNGNRSAPEDVIFARQDRLAALCLAECIENKGRFIGSLEEVLNSCVSFRSWVYPAHDGNLDNFYQRAITIDLKAAHDAHNFALCLYLLGSKINPQLVEKTRTQLHERIFAPYCRDLFEGQRSCWWKTATHNWNPVCHSGVVGAAITLLPEKFDRALFIERAIHYMDYYYQGFTPDGYCSEGLGYWNYGYGQYIVLSEAIYSATKGQIDLFSNPKGLAAAMYPFRIEILNGVYPAIADCSVNIRPQAEWMGYVNARLGLGDARWPVIRPAASNRSLVEFLMFCRMDLNRPVLTPPFMPDNGGPRTWFADAGVLLCRPSNSGSLAAVFKGGHNAEHHNHNDLGTFIVVVGDQPVIVDPGSVEYTRTTFGKDRYTIPKLRSYGHSVPRIGGQEQIAGRDAEAKILHTDFNETTDTVVMDLASAYPVQGLRKLQRTFIYHRSPIESLEVIDEFALTDSNTYEIALITYGTCKQTGSDRLEITSKNRTLEVRLENTDNNIKISDEVVKSTRGDFRRIAIQFADPVKIGKISMRISPKL